MVFGGFSLVQIDYLDLQRLSGLPFGCVKLQRDFRHRLIEYRALPPSYWTLSQDLEIIAQLIRCCLKSNHQPSHR